MLAIRDTSNANCNKLSLINFMSYSINPRPINVNANYLKINAPMIAMAMPTDEMIKPIEIYFKKIILSLLINFLTLYNAIIY